MSEESYKVYIKLDDGQHIVGVESNGYHDEQDLINQNYILIEEGANWRIHCHAQPNYLLNVFGKPLFDQQGAPNFKYSGGRIVELTESEKLSE